MIFATKLLSFNCSNKIQNLTKIQRNFKEIYWQQKQKTLQQPNTAETTININGFRRLQTKTAAAVAASPSLWAAATIKTTLQRLQTPCQFLGSTKSTAFEQHRFIYNKTTIKLSQNMVTSEEAVKYLEIPDKSENDKKHYKTLVLANGLHVLLVSDPSPVPHDGLTTSSDDSTVDSCAEESTESDGETTACSTSEEDSESDAESEEGDEKLAAVALLVDVGSFTEPPKYQGLAHFLEHMIFMGSKKYPSENAFDSHIKKCGGFDNANTECEETLFYFEVSEEHLDSSLDYFTALLKAPLMMKEAMTREREAVESEFQQTLYDDEARRDQLLASLANKDYPHSTFTWGNLKSLKDGINEDDLHKDLHEFCQRHYSGHRMYVCVQARLPIDELETLVVKHFNDVPSNNLSGKDFTVYDYRQAFSEEFHNEVFFVKPIENVCKLELTWVLPPMNNLYKCKPDQFLSYLLGYEGEGSLCAYLRKKLWGLELIAGVDESGFDTNSIYSLFNLCIYLTDSGFQHLDEVLAATFAYIQLFAQCGSLKEAYEELSSIEATSFRFASQKPAFDNVQNLVIRSKYYPPKDILTGTELYYEFDEEQVKNVIKHLNEFTFNIMITSQQKYDGITYDKKEKWFGTEYTSIKMPQKWQDLWQNCKTMSELYLPKPNRFISQDFRIFWLENGKPEVPLAPKKILQTDVCELWFRQDDKFQLPDAFMYFYFVSPLLRQSAQNDVLCALYAQLVKYRLAEELYPATVAGLSYQFYSAEKGVVLKVSGYNEKLYLVVDLITKAMVSMREHITEEQLEVFKKHQKKAYFNALIKPKALNKDIRLCIVENIRWPIIVKYKCLNDITLQDMLQFADNYTQELYVQTLMQGNLTEEAAHNVMNSVLTTLNCQNIKETKYIENRTVQLPQGSHYIRCNVLNDKDCNTVVTNFYQIGPCSVRIESILDLLMMFVEEPLFDSLRTKEQLGYYVASSVRINYGIAGYSITVNSQETKNSCAHVEERIEVFRGKMLQILEEMPQEDFEHVRESLIKIKQVVDMSLSEEVARNWGEITCEEYLFDRKRKEVEVLRSLGKQEIIDFCLNNERTNLRKLSVQVIGHTAGKCNEALEADMETETAESEDNPEEDDVASEMDEDEEANEELFNALANKLDLTFIPRDGDATTIVDINDFKENLHVYPITKTKLESPIIDTDSRDRATPTAGMDIIEDC
ncbi:nardilysin [Calliphora vicina]|uniref:nardilysin n=1 Tax=Calliphora vicina TaxID=7373 RepID=UPI00325B5200